MGKQAGNPSIYRCTECAGVDGTICHANTTGYCKKGSLGAKWEAVREEEATDVELENILAVGLEDAERIVREEIRKNAKPWGILLRRAE